MDEIKFVYPAIEAHEPYREITRDTPLEAHWGWDLVYLPMQVDPEVVFPKRDLTQMKWLPQDPKKRHKVLVDRFIEEGGVNLCQDIIRGRDIREGGLRLARCNRDCDGPTALEVIAWGIGVFREAITKQDTSYAIVMGETPLPKAVSKHMRLLRHHLVPHEDWGTDENGDFTDETVKTIVRYESTNIILADSYGELEQLSQRSTEKNFLTRYLSQLRRTAEFTPYRHLDFSVPNHFIQMNEGLARAWLEHIDNGIWSSPPESVDELLERVHFLSKNTFIDENPEEKVTHYEHNDSMLD